MVKLGLQSSALWPSAGAENQQLLLPPAAKFHKLLLVRERKENGLLFLLPFPSALSGQQIVQGKRTDFLPKNHTFDHMCFFCGDQASRSSTGMEKGLSIYRASSRCKCKQHYLLCTALLNTSYYYILLHITTLLPLILQPWTQNRIILVSYRFVDSRSTSTLIEPKGLMYDR